MRTLGESPDAELISISASAVAALFLVAYRRKQRVLLSSHLCHLPLTKDGDYSDILMQFCIDLKLPPDLNVPLQTTVCMGAWPTG